MMEYGKIIIKVSKLSGTSGKLNSGNPPLMLARSPTVGVARPKPITRPLTTRIAASDEGKAPVNLGRYVVISMVSRIRPAKI